MRCETCEMIRAIAALDDKNGIADDNGIPWQGKLPTDVKYYHDQIFGKPVLYGLVMYHELSKPYPKSQDFVLNDTDEKLRPGFIEVRNLQDFMKNAPEDLWVLGGANVFAQTMVVADELYLTRLKADFHCTKFFPEFEKDFELKSRSENQTENGIEFHYEIWRRKA